ncbi:pyridoxine/pyridoxal/pyridoxamine kinase [Jeotgalibacillus proteolyticus]|uniref:pyridoxal kinase n=1 Tax=Jeotgalibacillus proteolyticus TaxID=2082395 RepID=A0A2S5G9N8_9BACL|nr:pyridoxine/pyridoxal/pyridoxamine kinase [Jeotgalibacillus proteolyticus]PPA69706.1 bifunctional hydroxymethylpyrimidine kinase/phosphomethylpyrimidine kinase [Jeotgalibacillus proteolyticus]
MTLKKTLTIAGSDTSGGAGIQADLKTFQEHGTYGMTALTTVVTMDPENNWHHNVHPLPIDTLKAQLDTALSTGVDAIKTGMLGSVEIIETAAAAIDRSGVKNIVIDPVMVCKGEDEVLHPETVGAMQEYLLPRATVVTPNLFEAAQLAGTRPIRTVADMKAAAQKIIDLGAKSVVIKGGKQLTHDEALDLFYDGSTFFILEAEKADTTYTHGAGCTFAAAITANLANGEELKDAVENAKQFVTSAIHHGWKLNQYVGPVMHGAFSRFEKKTIKEQAVKATN